MINELTLQNLALLDNNSVLHKKNAELQPQLDWFKRRIFGEKSEKVIRDPGALEQLWLGGEAPPSSTSAASNPQLTIKEHVRQRFGKKSLMTIAENPG